MNKAICHGCERNKLLFTWELDNGMLKIETICKFCRSKEIVTINTITGIEDHKSISYRTFRNIRREARKSTI